MKIYPLCNEGFKYFSVVNSNMTSDIIFKLSPQMMIAAADEQTSDSLNEANIVNSKLAVKGRYVALLAGNGSSTEEMMRYWNDLPKGNFYEELNNLTKSFHEIYTNAWRGDILSPHNLDEEEYNTGNLKNGKPISADLLKRLQNETEEYAKFEPFRGPTPRFNSEVIFGGFNEKRNDMEIYDILGSGAYVFQPNRYSVGGSGLVRTSSEIMDFIESLTPEKRDNIPLDEGLNITLKALVKSYKSPGVGGIHPSIAIIEKDSVRKLNSKQSTIMRNLVFKELKGEIEENKAKRYLEDLANEKISTSSVVKEISKPEDLENYGISS